MKLSILIPTIPSRVQMFDRLIAHLNQQTQFYDNIEIRSATSINATIGEKRNILLSEAKGEYIAFTDDDDRISDDYINRLMWGIKLGVDCCSLKGSYSIDGVFNGIFEHSLRYNIWRTNDSARYSPETTIKYERYPNHLNCIRADIAKQFKFPEVNHGEDHNWAKQIHESGLLKTEHYIDSIIYYYDKRTLQPKG